MEGLFSFNTALTNSCGYEIKNYTRTDLQIPFNYGDKKKSLIFQRIYSYNRIWIDVLGLCTLVMLEQLVLLLICLY